jgi:DNA-binding transcriptional MocR family regulator
MKWLDSTAASDTIGTVLSQLDGPIVSLDRSSREPLSEQLAAALEARIARGLLSSGDRLPTTRELSAELAINRGTVQAAYRKLQQEGLVESRVGSGTVVRARTASDIPAFDPDRLLSARARGLIREADSPAAAPAVADFSRLTPDERFFPLEDFKRTLFAAWGDRRDLWQYAPPLGLAELREEIARRLAAHGVHRHPDEILVTSGAQQGLDLIFRTFADPGDGVALESPTYSGAVALARFAGVEIVPLPMEPDGPDASPLFGRRVKLVYTMPERQNPTGLTAGILRRRQLLEAAQASGALVIEDGYEEPESGLTPLSALDPERCLWLGTLSKDLVPGFRIGWIAGPAPVIEKLARVKKTADFQTPLPLQAAVAQFLREGADRKARRSRGLEVETRRIMAERALRHHLPELTWWGGRTGDALFWLHLPRGLSGRRVAERAAHSGVGVAPGADFDPLGQDRANLRLSVSRVEKRRIEEGIELLAKAIASEESSSSARTAPVV